MDLGDPRDPPYLNRRRRQAPHGAALRAQKVRVVVRAVRQLEPPDVVADIAAAGQADLDQIREVAVDGGAVEPPVGDLFADLRVAQGAVRSGQHAQHPDPRLGRAQPAASEGVPEVPAVGHGASLPRRRGHPQTQVRCI